MTVRTPRPPRADTAIHAELHRRTWETGEVYSYSYDPRESAGAGWLVWLTEHDWTHEVRNGQRRCACCAPELSPAGAIDMTRDALLSWLGLAAEPVRKMSKAGLVKRLRALPDLPAAAVDLLEAAA
jgi:hypothetical protein